MYAMARYYSNRGGGWVGSQGLMVCKYSTHPIILQSAQLKTSQHMKSLLLSESHVANYVL